MNYLSSTNQLAEIVTQEIFFSKGNNRTFEDIITKKTYQKGKYTYMQDTKGRRLRVRSQGVDAIRVTGPKPFEIKEEWMSKIDNYIVHFSNGRKETFHGVLTDSLKEGEFSKYYLVDGSYIMINDDNVDVDEVIEINECKGNFDEDSHESVFAKENNTKSRNWFEVDGVKYYQEDEGDEQENFDEDSHESVFAKEAIGKDIDFTWDSTKKEWVNTAMELPEYSDNDAAIKAGLSVGSFYRTGKYVRVVHSE